MALDSGDNLLSALRSLQLFSSQQVDEIERELLPHYPDAFDLSEYLVQIDWLTAYQRRLLFEERWNELAVGPFQILDRLGEGGASEVFKAWDTVRARVVALKVLRRHLAARPEALQELQRERQAVVHLIHPNIIKTYDAAQVDGCQRHPVLPSPLRKCQGSPCRRSTKRGRCLREARSGR